MKTVLSSCILFVCLHSIAFAAESPPNVILIIADDLGYGDLSVHGNPILKTPEIDSLARQSVRFDDYHAYPYCVPARAALLTGIYADRTGVHNLDNAHWFVRSDRTLVSKLFKNAGYTTGMFGKWHLGDNHPYGAESRGFDEVVRHFGGAIGVIADYWDNNYENDHYFHNGHWEPYQGYCTDVFFREATEFIDQAASEEKPFFVYLPTNVPHGPNVAPPQYCEPYANLDDRLKGFYGMIANLDENVGRLRRHLAQRGLADNTVFIFTSDNGTAGGDKVFNAGMRGKKGSAYDGGHRVPFFLHWPAGGFDGERKVETLANITDVTPTLIDLCGLEHTGGYELDGRSLRPLLEDGDGADWPERIIMTDQQYSRPITKWKTTAVMSERWRLIDNKELYDIQADPGQENDVYAEHPEIVSKLAGFYDRLWQEDIEPVIGDVAEIPVGTDHDTEVILNYHDCMYRGGGWYQDTFRRLGFKKRKQAEDKPLPRAFWPLRVESAGKYRIELRRWPVEADTAIGDVCRPPRPMSLAGVSRANAVKTIAFKATTATLIIGDQTQVVDIAPSDKAASFNVTLPEGSTRLSGFFDDKTRQLDAFYVHVIKE